MLSRIRERLSQPHYVELRERLMAKIAAGEIGENSDLRATVDSLEFVEVETEVEELGMEPSIRIQTVGDLLWLLRAIELRVNKNKKVQIRGTTDPGPDT